MCTNCLLKILVWQTSVAFKAHLFLSLTTSQPSTPQNDTQTFRFVHTCSKSTTFMLTCVRKWDKFASARLTGHLRWGNNRQTEALPDFPKIPFFLQNSWINYSVCNPFLHESVSFVIPFIFTSNHCMNSPENLKELKLCTLPPDVFF